LALYNKYRPTSIDAICGQPHIKRILKSQISKNDLVHAYIFHGPAGTGKTTVARILASMINSSKGMTCDTRMDDPFVHQIMTGKSGIDVYEMDAASNRSIDDIKDLRSKAYNVPMEMRKKVYIIDECHMLTREAWNAMLKLLEEPPSHAIFILCTTDLHKVLETVQTRCVTLCFKTLTNDEVFQYIKKVVADEKMPMTDDALRKVVSVSKGSIRDALSKIETFKTIEGTITSEIASDELRVADRRSAADFVSAAVDGMFIDALKCSSSCISKGVKPEDFFSKVAEILHDIMIYGAKGYEMTESGYTSEEAEEVKRFRDRLNEICGPGYRKLIGQWIDCVQKCSLLTVFNVQPQFQVDVAFVNLKNILKANESKVASTERGVSLGERQ
jgi:DNA polymerase-3 subunit gamma/tau